MTETAGISFWRRDLHWYIQQQSWTRSFYQADQSWTAELSGRSSPGSATAAPPNQSTGSASIAKPEPLDRVNARIEQASTGALPSSLSNATGGAVLDILV
jgi:hypothetical protein